jgi:uncharacterized protein (TIGR00730 family)
MGARPAYADVACGLGKLLVERDLGLVYGGGKIGLMGALADSVLAAGGEVIGVIPYSLEQREVAHRGLTELRVVNSMHERKALMAELSAAFLALPGGFGTLDELSEVLTWTQLGVHRKACGILNVEHFFDDFLSFLDHAVEEAFITPETRALLWSDTDAARLLDRLLKVELPPAPQWVEPSQI